MVSMLDRDRNHPSIILWSIGNEISEGRSGNPAAGPMAQRLAAICRREDPTRPVTSACPNPANDWNSGLARALDVFGINYEVGGSSGAYNLDKPGNTPPASPDPTAYHGQLPLVGSETASQVDTRGEYGLRVDAQGAVQIDPKPNQSGLLLRPLPSRLGFIGRDGPARAQERAVGGGRVRLDRL